MTPVRVFMLGLVVLAVPLIAGCRRVQQASAEDENPLESTADDLRLDSARLQQLGIEFVAVESSLQTKYLQCVGWFMSPPGAEVMVRAPVSGFTSVSEVHAWPHLGQQVAGKAPLAQVNMFLAPPELAQLVAAKIDTDTQVQQAQVTMELSEQQLKLASSAKSAITGVRLDQLREAFRHSQVAYQAGQQKLPFMIQVPDRDAASFMPVPIPSHALGTITRVHVAAGQFVQAGDPLWTISDRSKLWLRVAVYAGDYSSLDLNANASVSLPTTSATLVGIPLEHPLTAASNSHTIDVFFEVDNNQGLIPVGQSAVAELALVKAEPHLMIPLSAVLYGEYGRAYCYARRTGQQDFRRQQVELGATYGSQVAVVRGLTAGDEVVSVGAEQIWADEFKSQFAIQDDD